MAIEALRASVEEREAFIAVRTPSNPGYHFGNFLIFDRPPDAGDAVSWPARFDEVFAGDPAVEHAAFAWSAGSVRGAVEPFLDRGYTFAPRAVLVARTVQDVPVPSGLHIRAFRCDNDWKKQLDLAFATREEPYEREAYERFKSRQVAYHREIAGRFGVWMGAFEGDRLAGSCGIFSIGEGIARYQDVTVFPEFRNRGIARCLVSSAGRFAIERFAARDLVIVAGEDDFPRRIYERIGFTLTQREGALWIQRR